MIVKKDYKYFFEVRDYECDLTGIVNNANYLHYFEHARHKFLQGFGISFPEIYQQKGITLVISKAEIKFKKPLFSENNFYVSVKMQQESRLSVSFTENIHLTEDDTLIAEGKFIVVGFYTNSKKFCMPEEIKQVLDSFN